MNGQLQGLTCHDKLFWKGVLTKEMRNLVHDVALLTSTRMVGIVNYSMPFIFGWSQKRRPIFITLISIHSTAIEMGVNRQSQMLGKFESTKTSITRDVQSHAKFKSLSLCVRLKSVIKK